MAVPKNHIKLTNKLSVQNPEFRMLKRVVYRPADTVRSVPYIVYVTYLRNA
jgi:hypothetical protein